MFWECMSLVGGDMPAGCIVLSFFRRQSKNDGLTDCSSSIASCHIQAVEGHKQKECQCGACAGHYKYFPKINHAEIFYGECEHAVYGCHAEKVFGICSPADSGD